MTPDATDLARHRRYVVIACALVWTLLTGLALARHHTFHSSVYDLGIFHQVLWNTAHGRLFASSIVHMNYLGDHFSPSLSLLAPLEWLPRSLDLLLILHAGTVSLTAWNVWRLASRHLDPRIACLVSLATLFSAQLYDPAIEDLHPDPFVALALSFALLAVDTRSLVQASLWLLVALGGKEDSALLLCPLGVVLAFEPGLRVFGAAVAALSASYMAVVAGFVMPLLRPVAGTGATFYLDRFSHLGSSPSNIVSNTLVHPLHAILVTTTLPRVSTVVALLVPFALAPLRSRRTLAMVPFAAAHYLSARSAEFFFPYHNLVPVVPLLAWASVDARAVLSEQWPRLSSLAIVASAVLAIGWRFDPEPLTPRSNRAAIAEAIRVIPEGASVCVENWFGAHLSARRGVEFCTLWEQDRRRYEYYHWPETSSARFQMFDLRDTSHEHPALAEWFAALKGAGAGVDFEKDDVAVLEVDDAVLARARVTMTPKVAAAP